MTSPKPPVLSFESAPPADIEVEFMEIRGTYGSRHKKAGEPWSAQFALVPEMPTGALALWQRTSRQSDNGRTTTYDTLAVIHFIASLLDENVGHASTRFRALCDDPNRIVRAEDLTKWMFDLVEYFTEHPTGPVSTSQDGGPETETGSAQESPQPDTTPAD